MASRRKRSQEWKRPKAKRPSRLMKPDDVIQAGPLHMARFGRTVVSRSVLSREDHERLIRQFAGSYPDVCTEIDGLVTQIASNLARLEPLSVLHHAAWAHAHAQITSKHGDEAKVLPTYRMIDYGQSVIVSTAPESHQTPASDTDFAQLAKLVTHLYEILTLRYFLARSAHEKVSSPGYDHDVDSFVTSAQMHWLGVRGRRFQVHEAPRLRELLQPHSDVIEELFGINASTLVQGFEKLLHSLTFGYGDALASLRDLHAQWLEWAEDKIAKGDAPPGELMPPGEDWAKKAEAAKGKLELDIFDVEKVTALPRALLVELAFEPGEEEALFQPGEFRGWPLRELPIQQRPFLKIADRFYCFDFHLFDYLYRVLQKVILRLMPAYADAWRKHQQEVSEALTAQRLSMLFPGARVYRNVYYRAKTGQEGKRQWCETDAVVVLDDRLLVVEVKAGAFTPTSPATDFPALKANAKDLFEKPARQANRLLQELEEEDRVELCDANHKPVVTLTAGVSSSRSAMCVTLDPYTHLAAQAEYLGPIGADLRGTPAWVLSLDDLRVYTEILPIHGQFLHYMKQRLQAIGEGFLRTEDELVHLGLYLNHLRYVEHARQYGDADHIQWLGYTDSVDSYYGCLVDDPSCARLPGQKYPELIRAILEILFKKESPGRVHAACYLLDCVPAYLQELERGIRDVLVAQLQRQKRRFLSTTNEGALSISCSQDGVMPRDAKLARDHALASILINQEKPRLLLELDFGGDGALRDVHFEYLTTEHISEDSRGRLLAMSNDVVAARHKLQHGLGGVGRNAPCGCGSGRKYKKCCWLLGL